MHTPDNAEYELSVTHAHYDDTANLTTVAPSKTPDQEPPAQEVNPENPRELQRDQEYTSLNVKSLEPKTSMGVGDLYTRTYTPDIKGYELSVAHDHYDDTANLTTVTPSKIPDQEPSAQEVDPENFR